MKVVLISGETGCEKTTQIYATVRSGSIAITTSTLDSLLDLMAGGILWFTHLAMKNINIHKYPIGKLRVQPVGIIIFAAVMATLEKHKPRMKKIEEPESWSCSAQHSAGNQVLTRKTRRTRDLALQR
ncbi:putative metal tolerance protein C3 [Cajanus cajan]|uniref:putative metal tolerance protein C3 n=1 Tax=Cajanus cajan TaxID=3821 RepID=UPI00098D9000|nr:putative metal tolerance protein C3 [Cajanus cajan]